MKFILLSVIGAVVVFVLWALSGWIIMCVFSNPTDRGTFGDTFGAINALFSGWAFLGVVIAIFLQKQELEEQRHEIRESRIAQQASANALSRQLLILEFTSQIDGLNHIITSTERKMQRTNQEITIESRKAYDQLAGELAEYEQKLKSVLEHYFSISGASNESK